MLFKQGTKGYFWIAGHPFAWSGKEHCVTCFGAGIIATGGVKFRKSKAEKV